MKRIAQVGATSGMELTPTKTLNEIKQESSLPFSQVPNLDLPEDLVKLQEPFLLLILARCARPSPQPGF